MLNGKSRNAAASPSSPGPFSRRRSFSWGAIVQRTISRFVLAPIARRALAARLAQASAAAFEEVVAVVLAVVVGDFLAGLDAPHRHDHDAAIARDRLGVRPAGMIDITAQIPAGRAVDRPFLGKDEQVARVPRLATHRFFFRQQRSPIGDDVGPPLDRLHRKHTKAGRGTANSKCASRHWREYAKDSHDVTSDLRSSSLPRELFCGTPHHL